MGAIAVTNRKAVSPLDNRKVVEADLTFSASYATGGDTLDPKALGLRHITQIMQTGVDANGSGRPVAGKPTAALATQAGASIVLGGTSAVPLVLLYDAQSTQVANASNNAARGPFRVRVVGY